MRYLAIFLLSCSVCCAQAVSIGVAGGGRTTDEYSGGIDESKRYIFGPMIEAELPLNFAVEFDALYHRQGYFVENFFFSNTERGNAWEFPILLKYRIPVRPIKPFAEVGPVIRTISGTIHSQGFFPNAGGTFVASSSSYPAHWSGSVGIAAGGGVRFDIGRLSLSPEVRYTYWTSVPVVDGGNNGPTLSSVQSQLEVLMSVSWKVHR